MTSSQYDEEDDESAKDAPTMMIRSSVLTMATAATRKVLLGGFKGALSSK